MLTAPIIHQALVLGCYVAQRNKSPNLTRNSFNRESQTSKSFHPTTFMIVGDWAGLFTLTNSFGDSYQTRSLDSTSEPLT